MRTVLLAVPLLSLAVQAPGETEVQQALLGSWTGTLEYRDYSEPATSTKRVNLPTWLTVQATGADLRLNYIYDDGPSKTVTETAVIHFEASDTAQLREGRGTIVITAPGKESDKPVQTKTTYRIGRNIFEILEETAPEGEPFAFRHAYTFVRSTPP
jgi:hypothetical protein